MSSYYWYDSAAQVILINMYSLILIALHSWTSHVTAAALVTPPWTPDISYPRDKSSLKAVDEWKANRFSTVSPQQRSPASLEERGMTPCAALAG